MVWCLDRTQQWWWFEELGYQTALAYQPIAAPQPIVTAAALPVEFQQFIPAALAADEQHLAATRAREEADALRMQADQATQAAAAEAAVAQTAADEAAEAAHQYAADMDRTRAVRAAERAIADNTLGSVQTATLDIAQAAAARHEAATASTGVEAVPEATAQQAFQGGGRDEDSWSRLGPADDTLAEDLVDVEAPVVLAPSQNLQPTVPLTTRIWSIPPVILLRTSQRKHHRPWPQ